MLKRKNDHQLLLHIQQNIILNSTPAPMAQMVSWPVLGYGLSGTKQLFSGFQHLTNEQNAGVFKELYGEDTHPLQTSNKLINNIAYQLASAKKNDDKATYNRIVNCLDHDPLYADIRKLTKYKKLNFLQRHPLFRKGLIAAGIGIGVGAVLIGIAALIIFTGGFGGIVLANGLAIGSAIATAFGIDLAGVAAATLTGVGFSAILAPSLLAAAALGFVAGVIRGIVKRVRRTNPVPENPLSTFAAVLTHIASPSTNPASPKPDLKLKSAENVTPLPAPPTSTPLFSPRVSAKKSSGLYEESLLELFSLKDESESQSPTAKM